MTSRLTQRVHAALLRRLPERRLFIRSDDHTRFIRLKPETQLVAWLGSALFVAWSVVATAIVLMDSIGAGNFRAQAQRDKMVYEDRLNTLSAERDAQAAAAAAAQNRFDAALARVAAMQSDLLASEQARAELETGLAVVHATLTRTVDEREAARAEAAALRAPEPGAADAGEMASALDMMSDALVETAAERDQVAADAEVATQVAGDLDLELRLMEERNDEIFRQIEEAMTVSVEPIEEVFEAAGMDADQIIEEVRRGYSGIGGPLTPLSVSTMGAAGMADGTARANRILGRLDQLNLYSIALQRVPFAMPVQDPFRYTSPFGPRWGRMHEGVDMAAPTGTPIYATADGVVTFAGWQNGYGRIIKVQHEFGIETVYPHLNAIRVEVGQRVSLGEQIGDMGSSGRSTGPHLHYEIRVNGEPIDPMIYLRAGNDVL